MTQEQIKQDKIINQIVSKYLAQVEVCSSVEEQIIDVELEVDGITIYYGNTLHTEGHTEYRYDTEFCCNEPVDYAIDYASITDSSICFESYGKPIPEYISEITADILDGIIEDEIEDCI